MEGFVKDRYRKKDFLYLIFQQGSSTCQKEFLYFIFNKTLHLLHGDLVPKLNCNMILADIDSFVIITASLIISLHCIILYFSCFVSASPYMSYFCRCVMVIYR